MSDPHKPTPPYQERERDIFEEYEEFFKQEKTKQVTRTTLIKPIKKFTLLNENQKITTSDNTTGIPAIQPRKILFPGKY